MRILIITENFKTGGLETQIIGFCKHLIKANHEIFFISGFKSRTKLLKEIIGSQNVFEVEMNSYLPTSAFIDSFYKIIFYIKEINPDIIHLHPFTSIIYGGLASAFLNKPYVVTLHGPVSLNGSSMVYRIFLEFILKDAFRVFCVSKEVYEKAKALLGELNFVILPNAVDTKRFKQAQVNPLGPVALVSRLDPDKIPGIKAFLIEWSKLPDKKRIPIHVFGEGLNLEELKVWVKDFLKGNAWITFFGHRDDLNEVLKSGYSAVAGMGRVILEALSMELPAILVGYDGIKGVVNLTNIEDLAYRNFSGRYLKNITAEEVLKGLEIALKERFLLRRWVEERAEEKKIVTKYLEEIKNFPSKRMYWWKEAMLSTILEADDTSIFGEKVLFNILKNFSLNQGNIYYINFYLMEKVLQIKSEKREILKQNEELKFQVEVLKSQNEELRSHNKKLKSQNEELKSQNEELRSHNKKLKSQNEELKSQNEELRSQRDFYINKLNEIYTSNFWKLARTYYRIRDNTPFKYIYRFLKFRLTEKFNPYENENFNPYENLKVLKPLEVIVLDKKVKLKNKKEVKFSVITPVKNEGEGIYDFLYKIKSQTLKPAEVIIIENNSTDNTLDEIKRFINDYGKELNIKLIVSKENSLAKDRNIGIRRASNEILILLDAGIKFESDLFENLLATYSEFPDADLITGIYEPTKENKWAYSFVWNWQNVDFYNHIPSSRCLLIKKSKAMFIGGYPEFLPYTGEDTLFAIRYRKISNLWVINKKIKILWDAPTTKKEAIKKAFLYGWGDGLIGFGEFRYYRELSKWLKKKWFKHVFIKHTVSRAHFKGFLKGRKERNEYLKDYIKSVWLILSLVPFTDSGGGQRGTQIALELMKNKNKVVFCNVYPSFEEKKQIFLDIEPELLELYQIKDFKIEDFFERHKVFSQKMVILLEVPHPEFIPIIKKIKSLNSQTKVIYDCIDNWDSSLGWIWYKREVEEEVINLADYLIVSAETLRQRIQNMTSKPVYLIPNAVNTRIFKKDSCYLMPKDLPQGKPIVIYVGAMWGEWFDWDLLYEIAQKLNINLVLIGNCPQEKVLKLESYKNIYYLGLRSQFELPAYLSQAKVALIPFKYDNRIIKYTNPLKVYEYLAMGLPVVATYMDELINLPYVFLSKNYEEFVENLREALNVVVDYTRLKEFIEIHSWSKRIKDLLKIVEVNSI